jgi:hypothetical protein
MKWDIITDMVGWYRMEKRIKTWALKHPTVNVRKLEEIQGC